MNTYYVEFDTKEAMLSSLAVFDFENKSYKVDYSDPSMLNIVGLWYEDTGESATDSDGNEQSLYIGHQGWQVNYVGDFPSELQGNVITEIETEYRTLSKNIMPLEEADILPVEEASDV